MFQDVGGGGGGLNTQSFTFDGPVPIDPDLNYFDISVSGVVDPYTIGTLVSVELTLSCDNLADLAIGVYNPDNINAAFVLSNDLTGTTMTNTVFYNSAIQSYPNISTGVDPYTGTFNDLANGNETGYDGYFLGYTTTGNWGIVIYNGGLTSGTITQAILTFQI